MTTTPRPYRIEVPGVRARSASSLRNAEVALGQMMTHVANGTEGRIVKGAETVLIGVADTLGWSTRLEAGTLVTLPQDAGREQARIVRIVGYVAVVDVLTGRNAGRRLDTYVAGLEPVPMFEVVAELDGFDAWMAEAGEPATELVDGFEAVVEAPRFETIAEFAFAVEAAAGPALGRLFA